MRKDVEGARWKLHAEGCGWCTLEAAYGRMWKAHAGKERLHGLGVPVAECKKP